MHDLLFCLEVWILLFIVNPYIRSPINKFIIYELDYTISSRLLLVIIINILLAYILHALFRLLRSEFDCDYFELILISLDMFYYSPADALGIIYMATITEMIKYRRSMIYRKRAIRSIRLYKHYNKKSKIFNSITALLEREGQLTLRDSFRDWNSDNISKAKLYKEKADFFWRQGWYLANHTMFFYPPERSLALLTGIGPAA